MREVRESLMEEIGREGTRDNRQSKNDPIEGETERIGRDRKDRTRQKGSEETERIGGDRQDRRRQTGLEETDRIGGDRQDRRRQTGSEETDRIIWLMLQQHMEALLVRLLLLLLLLLLLQQQQRALYIKPGDSATKDAKKRQGLGIGPAAIHPSKSLLLLLLL